MVLKLERSMMGHFVILIENIIQLIIIGSTILLLPIRDIFLHAVNLEVMQSLVRCHCGCVGIPL